MICKKCGNNLDFDSAVLEKFVACPFCGTFFPKELPSIESGTIEAELKKLADDFGGLEIFSEENSSRFAKSLMTLSAPFDIARDKLLVANIRKIPQRLYSVLEQTKAEQQQMTDLCIDELASFGFPESFAIEVVSWIVHVLQMPVSVERKPLVEKKVSEKSVQINYEDRYNSSNLIKKTYQYKTCIIGNQEWFAENFHEESGKNERYNDYDNSIGEKCENELFGRLYDWHEAVKNAPEGWRLPTKEDFEDMVAYIESLGLDAGTALKSTNQWHGEGNSGLDLFGFCAYPTYRDKESGEMQAWFWTASATNKSDYPYYCVSLNADKNEFWTKSYAGTGYHACVRYVRDVKD